MKQIQPVSIWFNGEVKQATILEASAIKLELGSWAKFQYNLIVEGLGAVTSGNLVIEGADYQNWDQDTFAWDWIAGKLGLTITGDYPAIS